LLRRVSKRLVPRNAVVLARSAHSVKQLGLWGPWIGTIRHSARKQRLGTLYGGWTIPVGILTPDSICYCVGCGEDISFDLALIESYACRVHGFDPTERSIAHVRRVARANRYYLFYEFGIWDRNGSARFFAPRDSEHVSHSITNLQNTSDYVEIPTKRLSTVLNEHGHNRLDLLKLDIEGAEIAVIRSIVEDGVEIGTLLVEFDELNFPSYDRIAQIRATVAALLGYGYSLFHVESTNFTFVLDRERFGKVTPARASHG
jgi:FkbM family methyltransferase